MSSGKPEVPSSTERDMKNRVMELEIENSRLQRLVAELLLKNQRLRDVQRSDSLLDGAVDLCRPL
jgi:hypothetical protein